ncbi:hypothetical protein O9G_002495 [Rozella allomycis CSF55]|uniref:Uncharacterized protein n=1 Tax=Rozella allomycis (strain CSF55) TaxID=988480 RepID=A0A075AYZ2_ROZAC|nr:hypothetical protein O9G_002495 [Rozella allomycis CSF55]|eukprot:EPZ33932.1 hypothetical protein O9G_002495 [Rozella allomycis CSF55]
MYDPSSGGINSFSFKPILIFSYSGNRPGLAMFEETTGSPFPSDLTEIILKNNFMVIVRKKKSQFTSRHKGLINKRQKIRKV